MTELTALLEQIGLSSLGVIWFPLLIWTAIAIVVTVALRFFSRSDVIYHYHVRVALLASIPVGMLASGLAAWLSNLGSASAGSGKISFIVIQNPISAVPESAAPAINWADPYLWLGIGTAILALITVGKLLELGVNYIRIFRFGRTLDTTELDETGYLNHKNLELYKSLQQRTCLAFSGETDIPFTFGWRKPTIVVPAYLKEDPEKLNMVIRHELMHIRHGDYLVNGIIMAVKSMFWFHPLVYLFQRDIREFREISCDSEVLTDRAISPKKYAQLLLDLAQKPESFGKPVVSMSVNRSTLKKRIRIMKTLKPKRPIMRSIIVSLAMLVGISGFIACSDLQTTGVTKQDVEETQAKLRVQSGEEQPLFVVNGEIIGNNEFSRIKPKYISSITVLKGEKAVSEYGQKGKNGVVIIELSVKKEIALGDLKSPPPPEPASGISGYDKTENGDPPPPPEDHFIVVEQMPKLIGGLESIQSRIQYPTMARKAGIEGRVIVQFIVNKQGKVENPQVIQGIGGGCDEEALRVVKQAEFESGMQRGEPVRVQYSLPIEYKLPNSDSISEEKSSAYLENPKMEGRKLTVNNLESDESGTLSGTIINSESGEPIPRVNIVHLGASIGIATDRDGQFRLEGLPSGDQEFTISHVGFDMVSLHVHIQ